MSHVTIIDIEIRDLDCLRAAAEELGMEFREGQTKFKWWGHSVGDYPLPVGFTEADMGKCSHALAVKGKPNAYEVGVVARRDGKPGYVLMWDFFNGGEGLQKVVGEGCSKLCQKYSEKVVLKHVGPLQAKGWNMQKTAGANGQIVVRLVKG
jgi:hypothetical protein